jgi:hypothetical protein
MSFKRKIRRNMARRAKSPQVGDVCVGCVHKPNPNGANYFMVATPKGEPNLHVTHPVTKQHVMAKWVLLCDACRIKFGETIEEDVEAQKVPLSYIMVWRKEDGEVTFPEN